MSVPLPSARAAVPDDAAVLAELRLVNLGPELARAERWDDLFRLARREAFLAQQAARADISGDDAGPLTLLDLALSHAIRLERFPEIAAFMLSTAIWTDALRHGAPLPGTGDAAHANPLSMLRVGRGRPAATQAADDYDDEHAAVWHLLLAWELDEAGNSGDARRVLVRLRTEKNLPQLEYLSLGRYVATLLTRLAPVAGELFDDLERHLLDDNARAELCDRLVEAGELTHARSVADAIEWPHHRASRLARVAKAEAARGHADDARAIAAHALKVADDIEDVVDAFKCFARVAAAHHLSGDEVAADELFTSALTAAEDLADTHDRAKALAVLASEQASVGLLGEARSTVARIGDGGSSGLAWHEGQQALEELAKAHLGTGDLDGALRIVEEIRPSYLYYARALQTVAGALADAGAHRSVERLIERLDSDDRVVTQSSLAPRLAAAGLTAEALGMARAVEDATRRARALVGIAAASPQDLAIGAEAVAAATEEADKGERAVLLAKLSAAANGMADGAAYAEVIELTSDLAADYRWRVLANIALDWWAAGQADTASELFREAEAAVLETGSGSMDESLWDLGTARAEAGDFRGAREHFARALSAVHSPARRPDDVARVAMTLAGIALVQADSGDLNGARSTVEYAVEAADRAGAEWRGVRRLLIAEAQDRVGDWEGALVSVLGDAGNPGSWEPVASLALRLAERGSRERARHLLAAFSCALDPALPATQFGGSAAVAALACARAELGDFGGAREVAEWDHGGTAAGAARATIAKVQAAAGDFAAAAGTAGKLADRDRAQALRGIAAAHARNGDAASAEEHFRQAVNVARRDAPECAASALIEIAREQAELAPAPAASRTLEAAAEAAWDIRADQERDSALSAIAQAQAASRDSEGAFRTAHAIENSWLKGEALTAAALVAVADHKDVDALAGEVGAIDNDWWRVVGLATVAAAKDLRGGAGFREASESRRLLATIPEGDARARLQDRLVELYLAAGAHAAALAVAEGWTVGRDERLLRLALRFVERDDLQSFKQMIPACARDLDAAYPMCRVLAKADPAQAASVAREVAERARLS